MITFFPTLIVLSAWSITIQRIRVRRTIQAIIVVTYSMLGAMYQ